MGLLEEVEKRKEFATFIKTTAPDESNIAPSDKVALNRRANVMFNNGDTEGARKIFTATRYGDGLTRVGKKYEEAGKPLDALKEYFLAKNERGMESVYTNAAAVVSAMLKEDGGN